jgi:hypothetical protein
MPNPSIVHHLHHGRTPCEMRGVPAEWPDGHLWSVNWEDVTCELCKELHAGELARDLVRRAAIAEGRYDEPRLKLVTNVHEQVANVAAPEIAVCGDCGEKSPIDAAACPACGVAWTP